MRYVLVSGLVTAFVVSLGAAKPDDADAVAVLPTPLVQTSPVLAPAVSPLRSDLDWSAVDFDLVTLAPKLGLTPDLGPDARRFGRVQMRFDSWAAAAAIETTAPIATFDMTWRAAPAAVHGAQPIAQAVEPDARVLSLSYSRPLTAKTPLGLDVRVEPRLSAVRARDVEGVGGGALLRIGRNIAEALETEGAPRGMHVFIGADTQSLSWRPGAGAVQLREQMIVGDAQAGLGWRVGRADVAVGLMHREVKFQGATKREQFGGVSLVMRR